LLYATDSAIRFRIRNWTALVGIPRNSGIARTDAGSGILGIASNLIQFRNCWELIATIQELNGIELDGIPESVELIPGAESVELIPGAESIPQ
jgi:hypothetical protein